MTREWYTVFDKNHVKYVIELSGIVVEILRF